MSDQNLDETESASKAQLEPIVSEGFAAPVGNDDPFQPSVASVRQNPSTSKALQAKTGDKSLDSGPSKSGKGKQGILKDNRTRILKKPRAVSASTAGGFLDPEEERLKMLPDCCEFTHRKNDAYEIDDTRKEMSSAWFSGITLTAAVRKRLCFSESLLIMEENGTVVGKMYCSVTQSKWGEKACLCVHSGSYGKFSTGIESGTTITSFVDYKMKPLQEFVHEWATRDAESIERKTFLINEVDRMPCKITMFRNGKLVDTKFTNLGVRERENLVTEATNILLQRLLIMERRTNGSMILQSLSFTGKVVRAKYSELGSGWENVRGKQLKTWGIRRIVNVEENEERQWDCLYSKYSRMILRCQPDSPQALIPLWFENVVEFDKYGNFIGLFSPYSWACDAELYSKYSIKKEEITHEHRRYIMDHPEVTALLGDYLQEVLFRKPQNVAEFTKEYFDSFLNLRAKHANKKATKAELSSRSTSYEYYGTGSVSGSGSVGSMMEEWSGEGGGIGAEYDEFYKVDPTVTYDGMEKVDDTYSSLTQSEEQAGGGNKSDDDTI